MTVNRSGILVSVVSILTVSVAIPRAASAGGVAAVCGDGVVELGETCDPPGTPMPPYGNVCRIDCTYCGDGIKNGGEGCDGGSSIPWNNCLADCHLPLCGSCGGIDCGPDLDVARPLIDAACPCGSGVGSSRAQYTHCAGMQLIAAERARTVRHQCSNAVRGYYLRSTCWRDPTHTWVPCVHTAPGGRLTCAITRAARCTGTARVACPGYTNCLDALAAADGGLCP